MDETGGGIPCTVGTPKVGGPGKALEGVDTGYVLRETGGEGRLLGPDAGVVLANGAPETEGGPIKGCPGCCGATLANDDELDP